MLDDATYDEFSSLLNQCRALKQHTNILKEEVDEFVKNY
jgi:hypothetical protein